MGLFKMLYSVATSFFDTSSCACAIGKFNIRYSSHDIIPFCFEIFWWKVHPVATYDEYMSTAMGVTLLDRLIFLLVLLIIYSYLLD